MNNSPRNVESRRNKVTSLLAQAATEEEIAHKLNVNQSTVSRDIKHLKIRSRQFVYDLAKTDLCFYYKKAIDGVEEVNRKAWQLYSESGNSISDKRVKLLALRLIKDCNQAMFDLFSDGPGIMNIRALEERMDRFESSAAAAMDR